MFLYLHSPPPGRGSGKVLVSFAFAHVSTLVPSLPHHLTYAQGAQTVFALPPALLLDLIVALGFLMLMTSLGKYLKIDYLIT